jgi:hypothetical protein
VIVVVEPSGRSEPEKASMNATMLAVSWLLVRLNTGSFTKRASESTLPSCSTPKPKWFASCVVSNPTFSYSLRSCGILIDTLVEPSCETSAQWCSPFGPVGICW